MGSNHYGCSCARAFAESLLSTLAIDKMRYSEVDDMHTDTRVRFLVVSMQMGFAMLEATLLRVMFCTGGT